MGGRSSGAGGGGGSGTGNSATTSGNISNQREFDAAFDKAYDSLTNSGGLALIADIRDSIGSKVSKDAFDNFMIEAQANDRIQLISGSVLGYDFSASATAKRKAILEKSIDIGGGTIRTYVKRLD